MTPRKNTEKAWSHSQNLIFCWVGWFQASSFLEKRVDFVDHLKGRAVCQLLNSDWFPRLLWQKCPPPPSELDQIRYSDNNTIDRDHHLVFARKGWVYSFTNLGTGSLCVGRLATCFLGVDPLKGQHYSVLLCHWILSRKERFLNLAYLAQEFHGMSLLGSGEALAFLLAKHSLNYSGQIVATLAQGRLSKEIHTKCPWRQI